VQPRTDIRRCRLTRSVPAISPTNCHLTVTANRRARRPFDLEPGGEREIFLGESNSALTLYRTEIPELKLLGFEFLMHGYLFQTDRATGMLNLTRSAIGNTETKVPWADDQERTRDYRTDALRLFAAILLNLSDAISADLRDFFDQLMANLPKDGDSAS
jgi:hypothetical protein